MDHKSWPWKKKSSEKLMIAADKVNRGNEDEANLADKVELEKKLKILDEKLSAALSEINAKDEIAKKQTNIAREAIQGWEKAETEVLALKQELEKVTQQSVADGERLHDADAALKECMMQLRFVREEQEKRIQDAVVNTSKEFDKRISILEEKLAESNKILSKLNLENMQLSTTLSVKEKMIDELQSVRGQLDYDLRGVVSQLESTQRENSSLSYEVRVLEKELEIRNEEREFNRRTSEVAHKQYLGSVKKIAKLETETQRLRLLVQKRLPGPADVAKMKNATEVTRRRSNPFPMVSTDYMVDDASSKKIAFLTEQLCSFEEENRLLKEFLNQKTSELSKSQTSEMGSDEKVSMAESWAPSCYTAGASDIGLMDDFVEMEKLALVSGENPSANSSLVQENHIHWLDNILKVVAEHASLMQRSSTDMLDDIRVALAGRNKCNFSIPVDKKDTNGDVSDENMNKSIQKLVELIKGIRLSDKDDGLSPFKTSETPTGYTVHIFQWKTSELQAILEEFLQVCNKLVNGKVGVDDFVNELTSAMEWIVNHCFSLQDVSSMKDEIKKHFEWDETRSESEVEGGTIGHLSEVDKLTFPKDQLPGWPMASSWSIKNKIFHLEPNVKEEVIKLKDDIAKLESANKDLEGKLQTECDKCASLTVQLQESDKAIGTLKDQTEADIMVKDDIAKLESANKNLEGKLQTESDKCVSLTVQLQESDKAIGTLKDQTEADIMVKDLDKYRISIVDECNNESHQEPTVIKDQEISTSSNEKLDLTNIQPESMTEKNLESCDMDDDEMALPSEHEITTASEKLAECQETISNLGKQLKAMASLPIHTSVSDSSEVTVSTLTSENNHQKISLLDKMIIEDAAGAPRPQKTKGVSRTLTSPAILDGNSNPVAVMSPRMFVSVEGVKDEKDEEALVNFLSIVPNKKKSSGGGILRRLFWKKKKGNNK